VFIPQEAVLHDVPLAEHVVGAGKQLFPFLRKGLFEDRQQADGSGDMEEGGGGAA
jgi:hypothetical protein